MTHIITGPGDYRTAAGGKMAIDRTGKRGRFAFTKGGQKYLVSTGQHLQDPSLDITGPWISPEAMVDDGIVQAPAPKPLELWVNVYDRGISTNPSESQAKQFAGENATRVAVHMIEAAALARVQKERDEAVALLRAWYGSFNEWAVSRNAFLAKIGGGK